MSVVCKCFFFGMFFFFKQKTAYEMRISDWSSDVCSSDLHGDDHREGGRERREADRGEERATPAVVGEDLGIPVERQTFRRKQQALLLVQRHAEDDDERRHEEQRSQRHIAAAQPGRGHTVDSRRPPPNTVRPPTASQISTRRPEEGSVRT